MIYPDSIQGEAWDSCLFKCYLEFKFKGMGCRFWGLGFLSAVYVGLRLTASGYSRAISGLGLKGLKGFRVSGSGSKRN